MIRIDAEAWPLRPVLVVRGQRAPGVALQPRRHCGEAEQENDVEEGSDDDHPGDVETQHHSLCAGLTIDGVMASQRLANDRKETTTFGFKLTVCEEFVTKANLFTPESFR